MNNVGCKVRFLLGGLRLSFEMGSIGAVEFAN